VREEKAQLPILRTALLIGRYKEKMPAITPKTGLLFLSVNIKILKVIWAFKFLLVPAITC